MIYKISGKKIKLEKDTIIIERAGIYYEISISATVYNDLVNQPGDEAALIIYHYFNMENNRAIPVLIGFKDELERDFFEKFIKVSGIGPKAALKALAKPISYVAKAIEEADITFLRTLAGIGSQKAKQIVAQLQGKVGRFALIKEGKSSFAPDKQEIIAEAKQVLKRLQYSSKETDEMIQKVVDTKPQISTVEDLLNEIYRQRG